jgi:hypothetical protein
MNGGENSHAAATTMAFQDIDGENSSHKFGPRIVAWVRGCRWRSRWLRERKVRGGIER